MQLLSKIQRLLLTLSTSSLTYQAVNQILNFTYVITNTGNVTPTGPFTITDSFWSVSVPLIPFMSPGSSAGLNYCGSLCNYSNRFGFRGSRFQMATASGFFDNQPITSPQVTLSINAIQTTQPCY